MESTQFNRLMDVLERIAAALTYEHRQEAAYAEDVCAEAAANATAEELAADAAATARLAAHPGYDLQSS